MTADCCMPGEVDAARPPRKGVKEEAVLEAAPEAAANKGPGTGMKSRVPSGTSMPAPTIPRGGWAPWVPEEAVSPARKPSGPSCARAPLTSVMSPEGGGREGGKGAVETRARTVFARDTLFNFYSSVQRRSVVTP